MSDYIETRPEAIEAIKESIRGKWDTICMGCAGDDPTDITCDLCNYADHLCHKCPLERNGQTCSKKKSLYSAWQGAAEVACAKCKERHEVELCREVPGCPAFDHAPEEAEAMLEALVQLLPPEHRTEFGG